MRRPLLVGLAFLFFATVFVVRIGGDMVDFEVNYRAAARIRAGQDLYRSSDGHFMFKYFPFAAILYVPLSYLPLNAAKAVWYAGTVLCSIALFVVSRRLVSGRAAVPWFVLAIPPVALAKFFFREMKLGQINTIVTLLLLWMLWELLRERDGRAGAVWGLATAVKPYGLIFLPYLIARGRVRALGAGLSVLGAAFFLPAFFYGLERNVEVHREWYRTLSESTPAQLVVADNVSIVGLVAKWSGEADLAMNAAPFAVLSLSFLVLLVIVRGWNLPRAPVLEVALLLLLIPLVSPLGWDYQLLTSVLAITLLAHHWLDFSPPWRALLALDLVVVGFSIYDLIGRSAYRSFMAWSVLTPCLLLWVGFLVSLRWRRLK